MKRSTEKIAFMDYLFGLFSCMIRFYAVSLQRLSD